MTLTNEERETHFNMTGDDHGRWHIFTDDPFWLRRLDKCKGAECIRAVGEGKEYTLPANWLRIQKPPKGRKIDPNHLKKMIAARSTSHDDEEVANRP